MANKIPEKGSGHELHRLLGVLFTTEMSAREKMQILKTEYGFPVEEEIGKELSTMCNLSEWVIEKGMKEGLEKGMKQGMKQGRKRA